MEEKTNEEEEETCVIPGYSSINDFSQQTLKAVLQATRSSNDLPVGDDYDFYSTFRSVRDVMDIEGQRILSLLQRLLRHQTVKGNLNPSSSMDLEDRFDVLIDTNDQILERAGTLLDEASGVKKQEAKLLVASTPKPKVATSWNKKEVTPTNKKAAAAYHLLTARNIQRPQVRFKDKIDNSNHPFKPVLREKPNALKSLEDSLKLPENVTLEESESVGFAHPHPYIFEIEEFTPGNELLSKVTPKEPLPINLTPLIHVNTTERLTNMLEDLRRQKEIAIDLEHHSYRSFQGMTCLMQISTRSHDYIVDTLDLRDQLHVLNDVFTNPKITKVLHGADMDILWLQRDLGLYVVNMFDTGQAARVLGLSRFSLAHLLMQYCQVQADKQFQLADWRIRPLPEALVNYAREDTHYLLYIYDLMRNQLLDHGNTQSNLLLSVYSRSKIVATQVYRKPAFLETDYLELYKKSRKMFNNQQLAALQDLYQWRDQMARVEDESFGYVLPNHMLLQIAEILPREQQGVLACCNPIPPLVRQNLPELHKMVLQAREITLAKVDKSSLTKPSESQHPKYNADSLLHCRHDMTRHDEMIADIEKDIADTGLIANTASMFQQEKRNGLHIIEINDVPLISAFSLDIQSSETRSRISLVTDKIKELFPNPFTKFLAKEDSDNIVKPVLQDFWILKQSNVKKKADQKDTSIDLDSFEPEYAPPTKKGKVTINLTSSKPTAGSLIDGDNPDGSKSKPEEIRAKITSKLQTLRDEVKKAKKRLKEKEKEKKVKEKPQEASQDNPWEAVAESVSEEAVADVEDGEIVKKNKKNKSKKIKLEPDTEVEAFDYDAEAEKLKDEASKAKKLDVFDPMGSSKNKKKDKGKKKGAGDKSKSKGQWRESSIM